MGKSENIRVVIRFRPMNERELNSCVEKESLKISYLNKNRTVVLKTTDGLVDKTFHFDYVFPPETQQGQFFSVCAEPIMNDVLTGFNGTIFAYGQTGSGKTWSMMGPTDAEQRKDVNLRGIIPRCGEKIFDFIDKDKSNQEYKISVSYLEIYRDVIQDLLDPTRKNLKIHESPTRGVFVKNLTEYYIQKLEDIYYYLRLGDINKKMASTEMNKTSSRSHSVFTVKVEVTDRLTGSTRSGKVNLVDLAGSEKVKKSGAQGDRLEEAKQINKSLSALGHCINCIVEKTKHIPYRNSKILQESLGGNSKTTVVCAVSPHPWNLDETISTLGFGVRAKSIKLRVKQNIRRSAEELERIVASLERQLRREKLKNKKLLTELAKYRELSPEEKEELEKLNKVKEVKGGYVDEEEETKTDVMNVPELQFELKKVKCILDNETTSLKEELEMFKKKDEERLKKLKLKDDEILKLKEEIKSFMEKDVSTGDIIKKFNLEKQKFEIEKREFKKDNEELSKRVEELQELKLKLDSKGSVNYVDPKEKAMLLSNIEKFRLEVKDLKEENEILLEQIDEIEDDNKKIQKENITLKNEFEYLLKTKK